MNIGLSGRSARAFRTSSVRDPAWWSAARIANIGVHGKPATLHLEDQWARDITITTGLVDASSTPTLMRLVGAGQLDTSRFVTHRFGMDEFEQAYDVFGDATSNGALKVVLTRQEEADE